MADVYCFSYVEDLPSASVVRKLVASRNAQLDHNIVFRNGFPAIMGGFGAIKSKCNAFLNMARGGIYTLVLTDLDTAECACSLIRDWFDIPKSDSVTLPSQCIFRVAVREVESWILADRAAWAEYIGIPEVNFSMEPDQLDNPKEYLLNVIRRKGNRKICREMLPQGAAHIGPKYNDLLCDFVDNLWVPERASKRSPSLKRTIKSLTMI